MQTQPTPLNVLSNSELEKIKNLWGKLYEFRELESEIQRLNSLCHQLENMDEFTYTIDRVSFQYPITSIHFKADKEVKDFLLAKHRREIEVLIESLQQKVRQTLTSL